MLENISKLKFVIDGREVNLYCPNDMPIPALKEALFQYLKFLGQVEDSHKAAQENAKIEEKPSESPSEVEKEA
jgi:hypothetical protein